MFNHVLLAIDLAHKDEQKKALLAAQKYIDEGSHVYIVSVIPPLEGGSFVQSFLPADYDKHLIEKTQAALKAFTQKNLTSASSINHLVAHGKIYEKITDIADELDIDLIIASASSGQRHAFGPNVARIVRNANCSVLVVR